LKHEAQGRERPGLVWFPTDRVLHEDSAFRTHFEEFARSQEAFFTAYSQAHKQLSELGAAFAFEVRL
jgi:L-ascorbate peroxidase